MYADFTPSLQFDNRDHVILKFSKELKIRQYSFPIKDVSQTEAWFQRKKSFLIFNIDYLT